MSWNVMTILLDSYTGKFMKTAEAHTCMGRFSGRELAVCPLWQTVLTETEAVASFCFIYLRTKHLLAALPPYS